MPAIACGAASPTATQPDAALRNTAGAAPVPSLMDDVPAAGVVNARLPILEIAAIAAAGIALVICLDAPPLIWLLVLALTAARKQLRGRGIDLVLWDRPKVVHACPRVRRRSWVRPMQ